MTPTGQIDAPDSLPPVPEAVKRAMELNYEDRAQYWEQQATNARARAARCEAQGGNSRAVAIYLDDATMASGRALSERRHWIAQVLDRAAQVLDGPDPGGAGDVRSVLVWIDQHL